MNTLLQCDYKGEKQGYSIFMLKNIEDGLLELLTLVKKEKAQVHDIKMEHRSLEQRFIEIAKGEK